MKKDLASVLADLRRENVETLTNKPTKTRDDLVKAIERLWQLIYLGGEELETGKRKWMELWDSVDKLLPDLVSLAGIPSTAYRGFCLAVHGRMLEFIDMDWSMARDAAMSEVERRLRATQDAIVALSETQRRYISRAMLSLYIYEYENWTNQIPNMLRAIAKITGSAPYRPNEPRRRGPKRERSNLVLREFVRDLWRIAQANGGDFSLYVDAGDTKGTLVKALRLLAPVLPPGTVPRVIPSTLKWLRPDRNFGK
jgi:hypothetical protein